MTEAFPRVLLLTRWAPGARYAGGEALRKVVGRLPREQIRWACLDRAGAADGSLPESRGFPPREAHWRLRRSFLQMFYVNYLQAGRLSREIAEWVKPFRPGLIWVASDMEAISVALRLEKRLGIPVHATVYDAYECCRLFTVPASFYPLYMRHVRRFLGTACTIDAVSAELVDHVRAVSPAAGRNGTMVLPASVGRDVLSALPERTKPDLASPVRRIGFCGASRASRQQWLAFMAMLGQLPWQFEILAFAQQDHFHGVPPDGNVTVRFLPYAPTEADVMKRFRASGVHACYLGLVKEAAQALFAATSLSSKLTTYAGAGLPVIADAPVRSVAWRLVEKHGAGIRCGDDAPESLQELTRLFSDAEAWARMADGASRMCREEFDLDRNAQGLQKLLRLATDGG